MEAENFDEELKFTTINQTWFKFLALVSFLCALFVNAALLWLIVCRPNRLPLTDEQIKKDALLDEHMQRKKKHCRKRKRLDFCRRLRYLIFGRLKVQSPHFSSSDSSESSTTSTPAITTKSNRIDTIHHVKEKKNKLDNKNTKSKMKSHQ